MSKTEIEKKKEIWCSFFLYEYEQKCLEFPYLFTLATLVIPNKKTSE